MSGEGVKIALGPDDKCLVVELIEKNGGRHQSFVIENEDLVRAGTINELQVR